jgi:hypothetical protein
VKTSNLTSWDHGPAQRDNRKPGNFREVILEGSTEEQLEVALSAKTETVVETEGTLMPIDSSTVTHCCHLLLLRQLVAIASIESMKREAALSSAARREKNRDGIVFLLLAWTANILRYFTVLLSPIQVLGCCHYYVTVNPLQMNPLISHHSYQSKPPRSIKCEHVINNVTNQ